MNNKIYTLDEISETLRLIRPKYHIKDAKLFGSYARGEANASSDIDILLTRGPGFRALDVFGVAEEMHRATGKQVDVYEESELEPGSFRDTVLREALAL